MASIRTSEAEEISSEVICGEFTIELRSLISENTYATFFLTLQKTEII